MGHATREERQADRRPPVQGAAVGNPVEAGRRARAESHAEALVRAAETFRPRVLKPNRDNDPVGHALWSIYTATVKEYGRDGAHLMIESLGRARCFGDALAIAQAIAWWDEQEQQQLEARLRKVTIKHGQTTNKVQRAARDVPSSPI